LNPIEIRKTDSNNIKSSESDKYRENNPFLVLESTPNYSLKENSANSQELREFGIRKRTRPNKSEIIKRRIINMMKNENVVVGFTSMTEIFLSELLEKDLSLLKDVLNLVYTEVFDNPEELQKFIEIMSNLEYEVLHPTNTILALGVIQHTDIGVQEAAIAAFEKWDDKTNLKLLKNINYTADWIEDYANEVIQYLEGC
jgi:hypothetical protein